MEILNPTVIREELEFGCGYYRQEIDLQGQDEKFAVRWFLQTMERIGTPLSQSAEGEKILNIRNEGFGENDPRTRGPNTNRRLGFHTDRCDVIAFLCLQAASWGGENHIVQSERIEFIIRKERPDLHRILMKPYPYKRHVVDSGNPMPFCMQPIFSWKGNFFACSYLRVLIERADADPKCPNLSPVQRQAIDFLDEVCERRDLQTRVTLKRGDFLLLNNWTTLHRRTEFQDHVELSRRRHLLRIWLSMPNSRPLDESFRINFGSVEAGALRGGFQTQS